MINRTISRTRIYFFNSRLNLLSLLGHFPRLIQAALIPAFCAQKGSRLLVKSIEVLRPIESVMEVCNMDELDFKSVNFHSPADVLG